MPQPRRLRPLDCIEQKGGVLTILLSLTSSSSSNPPTQLPELCPCEPPRRLASRQECLYRGTLQSLSSTIEGTARTGLIVLMQSLSLLGPSGLCLRGSTRQHAPKYCRRSALHRTQVSCRAVTQASQARDSSSSTPQSAAQAERDASDTIRALDSILGSTDEAESKQDGPSRIDTSASISAFSAASGTLRPPSGGSQGSMAQKYQGLSTQSK